MMEIPEGWSFERLDSHINLLSGFAFKSAQYSEDTSDIKLLRGANVSQGNLTWLDVKYWPASETQELARYRLEAGDIVVSMDRTWIPAGLKVAVVKSSDLPSLLVQRVARLRAKATLTQGLLATIIQSNRFVGHVKKTQTETAVPHISPKDIRDYKVYIAPLPEQQKIAKILRTWDRAIAATKALITASEAQKKALMQQLLTGKRRLPGFEGAWKEVKLGDIFQFKKGQGVSKKAVAKDGVFPCVLYGELYTHYGDVIRAVKSATNSNEGIPSVVGDVLIPASTTTTGIDLANATAVLEDGIRLGGDINVLRPLNTNTDSRFMARLLTYAETFKLARRAQGSTIVHLYGSHLKDIVVFVPSHAEQVEISNAIDLSEQPIQALQAKLQTLKTEKAALMQQLLTGKRRVKLTEAAA